MWFGGRTQLDASWRADGSSHVQQARRPAGAQMLAGLLNGVLTNATDVEISGRSGDCQKYIYHAAFPMAGGSFGRALPLFRVNNDLIVQTKVGISTGTALEW